MSLVLFCQRLERVEISPNDRQWMPRWLEQYASQETGSAAENLPVTEERVLSFLRGLRDAGVPAWQRLQAARAVEWYQTLVWERADLDFACFKEKLGVLAERERRVGRVDGEADPGMPGEGQIGEIDPTEPEPVRALRARMRLLHHPRTTEDTYVSWVARFIRHLDDERLERFGESEIGGFLTDLAVVSEVGSGTQNQALSALLFYYGKVLGRDLKFIQRVRAKSSKYRPVVLSQREVAELLSYLRGESETMFRQVLAGGEANIRRTGPPTGT